MIPECGKIEHIYIRMAFISFYRLSFSYTRFSFHRMSEPGAPPPSYEELKQSPSGDSSNPHWFVYFFQEKVHLSMEFTVGKHGMAY